MLRTGPTLVRDWQVRWGAPRRRPYHRAVTTPGEHDGAHGPASALPPMGARILAVAAILVAGACGALIGYAFTDLQCTGDCTVPNGLSALIGAAMAAGGTAVVAVLTLRAMGEWQTIRAREERAREAAPPPGPPTC